MCNIWRYLTFMIWLVFGNVFQSLYSQEIQMPQEPMAGQKLFLSKECVKCHSIFGEGGKVGADLGRTQANKNTMDIVAAMWNHSWEMNRAMLKGHAIPKLTPEEMGSILSFLYYLKYLDEPGSAREGEKLFSRKGCIQCHRIGDKGGDVGPALDTLSVYASPVFLAQKMWNHGRKMIRQMKQKGIEIPRFQDNEVADLLAYLQSVNPAKAAQPGYAFPGSPQRGASIVEEKGCLNCHEVDGKGKHVGPNLSEKKFHEGVTKIAGRMWNHAPRMWKKMEAMGIEQPLFVGNEMADVIAYLYFLGFKSVPGDLAKGERLFREKGCIKCHATDDEKNKVGPNLSRTKGLDDIISISAAMWNHNIKMQEEMKKQDVPFPRFTGEDLSNLLRYIRSLREQENGTD